MRHVGPAWGMGCSRPGSSCRLGTRLGCGSGLVRMMSGHNIASLEVTPRLVRRVAIGRLVQEDALLRSAKGARRAGWRERGEKQAASSRQRRSVGDKWTESDGQRRLLRPIARHRQHPTVRANMKLTQHPSGSERSNGRRGEGQRGMVGVW